VPHLEVVDLHDHPTGSPKATQWLVVPPTIGETAVEAPALHLERYAIEPVDQIDPSDPGLITQFDLRAEGALTK
jgi:hypothetical protein